MKQYPSIFNTTGQRFEEFVAYVFDKLDGANIRAEWNRKNGFYKFGSRHVLLDETHQPLSKIFRDQRYESAVAFIEYWSPTSFAGKIDFANPMQATLFDVAPYKQGLMGPKDFLKLFGTLNIPRFLGTINWTRDFVGKVWREELEGITEEGVVGKAKEGRHDLILAKAKTERWIMKVRALYAPAEAEKIIAS
jgi:hypothetical protein